MLGFGKVANRPGAWLRRDAREQLVAGDLGAQPGQLDHRLIIDHAGQLEARALEVLDDPAIGFANILFGDWEAEICQPAVALPEVAERPAQIMAGFTKIPRIALGAGSWDRAGGHQNQEQHHAPPNNAPMHMARTHSRSPHDLIATLYNYFDSCVDSGECYHTCGISSCQVGDYSL